MRTRNPFRFRDPGDMQASTQVPLGVRASAGAAVLGIAAVGALTWQTSPDTSAGKIRVEGSPSTTRTFVGPSTSTSWSTSSTSSTTTTRPPMKQMCVESAESPGAVGASTPEGFPWITFHVSARAARDALLQIARHASEAREALGDAGAVGVRVYCDIEELAAASNISPEEAQERVTKGTVAYMQRGDMWLYGPSFEKHSSGNQRHTVYHEYFHALQRSLSRLGTTRSGSAHPFWLIEGSARFFERVVKPGELEAFRRDYVRRWDASPALEALETSGQARSMGGTGDAYTVGAVAMDYLAAKYGRERVQTQFWTALAGTDWRSAFEGVFGTTVDTFYSEFGAYRQTLRP